MIRKFSKHRLLGQRHQGYGVTRDAPSQEYFLHSDPFSLSQLVAKYTPLSSSVHTSPPVCNHLTPSFLVQHSRRHQAR